MKVIDQDGSDSLDSLNNNPDNFGAPYTYALDHFNYHTYTDTIFSNVYEINKSASATIDATRIDYVKIGMPDNTSGNISLRRNDIDIRFYTPTSLRDPVGFRYFCDFHLLHQPSVSWFCGLMSVSSLPAEADSNNKFFGLVKNASYSNTTKMVAQNGVDSNQVWTIDRNPTGGKQFRLHIQHDEYGKLRITLADSNGKVIKDIYPSNLPHNNVDIYHPVWGVVSGSNSLDNQMLCEYFSVQYVVI